MVCTGSRFGGSKRAFCAASFRRATTSAMSSICGASTCCCPFPSRSGSWKLVDGRSSRLSGNHDQGALLVAAYDDELLRLTDCLVGQKALQVVDARDLRAAERQDHVSDHRSCPL